MQCFCKEESYDLVVEADLGADPIWCGKCGCNLNLEEIPLTEKLKYQLISWVQAYSKSVIDESEYIYEVTHQHNKNGIKLAQKAQSELGNKYTISYKAS